MSDLSDTNVENVSFEINDNSSPNLSEDERKKGNVKNGKIPESCEDEQSHITEVNDEHGEDDILNSPEKFKFYLDSQEWKAIKPSKKNNTKRRRLKGQWTNIFSQKFFEKNKVCVLKFTRNAVKKKCSRKTSSKFFVGKAVCKFSGCCAYDFYINEDPGKEPKKVKVRVCRSGDIHHTRKIKRRQLKGTAREEMKKDLKSVGVSNVYYKNIASLSEIEKKAGNLTKAPSKEVLHNLRKEDTENQLLSKDPISEVILTGDILRDEDNDSKSILGYIQSVSVLPFTVVLFTEATIRLLRRALVHNIPLHLDATGSVVQKIKGQNKPVFYYALVMKDTSSVKSPIIPVAELITNSNTTVNITHFLGRVKEASIRLGSRSVRPVRIEVDFSWPLINSILLVFNAENMVKYLQKCWNTLYKTDANKDNSDYTVVHICAFHMMGIIKQKLSNIDADKKLKEFGKFCFALLQNSDCLDEATEIYSSICKVLGSKECCEGVQISLTSLKNKIAVLPDKLTEEDQELSPSAMSQDEPDLSILTESSIKKSSPFEMHFKNTKDLALSEITEEGIENDYWSPEILKVFEMYMYLYPVWSGSMLRREGITRDTNADVENWFGVVKNTILQKKKNINAGLFIRKLHIQIKGRTAEFSLPMHSTKATEKNLENLEEVWRKTPQKRKGKKSKYFHSPKTIPTPRKKVRSASKKGREKKQEGNRDDNDNINISAKKVPLNTAGISRNTHEKLRGQNDDFESFPKLSRRKLGHSAKRGPMPKNTSKKETPLTETLEEDLRAFPKNDSDSSSNVEIVSVESEDIASLLTTGIHSDCEDALPKISKRKRNLFLSPQQKKKRPEIPPKEFGSRPKVVIVSSESDDSNAEQEWKPKACGLSETLPTNSKGKRFENNYHGIYNTRNNCWLNSTLQALTPFMTLFKNVKRNTGNVLFDTCNFKVQCLRSPDVRGNITVDDVLDILNTNPEYRGKGNEQQDPALLFSELYRELAAQLDMNKLILTYQHSCCKCQKKSHSPPENVFVLSTEIPCAVNELSVQDCLTEFLKEEVIDKYCRLCNRSTKHIRTSKICQLPQVFIIQLKRFTPTLKKLNSNIFIDRKIVISSDDEAQYLVKAVQRNCYILIYEREDEREKEFTEMDVSSNSGKDVEGEDLEDNVDFVQKEEGSTSTFIGPYQLKTEDIKSLDGSNWITDQVVNSYLYMIVSYTKDTAFMDSFWIPLCIKKGVMEVRKVTHLQQKRVLLIPLHKPAHWGLVIVYIHEGYFVVVDTLKAFGKEVATIVRRFLLRHKLLVSRNKALEQKFKPPVGHMDHCGPYILQIAKNEALQFPQIKKWKEMSLIRQEIREDLLRGKICEK